MGNKISLSFDTRRSRFDHARDRMNSDDPWHIRKKGGEWSPPQFHRHTNSLKENNKRGSKYFEEMSYLPPCGGRHQVSRRHRREDDSVLRHPPTHTGRMRRRGSHSMDLWRGGRVLLFCISFGPDSRTLLKPAAERDYLLRIYITWRMNLYFL